MKKAVPRLFNFKTFLAILIGSQLFFLFTNKHVFLQKFNPEIAQKRYQESSYGRTKASYILSDEELYATEGYFLVEQNRDLHNLTPGHPPLGKYIIGLSIKLFGNPYFF